MNQMTVWGKTSFVLLAVMLGGCAIPAGSFRDATGLLLAERFDMQAQDVVFVDEADISQWNRVISQLLPSISVIGIADGLGTNYHLPADNGQRPHS